MGTSLVLRPGVPEDVPAVAELWHLAWRDGHLGNVSDELVAARTRDSFFTRAAERVADTTVAVADGRIAGFIMVVDDEVEQVFVGAEFRGRGVAALLLSEAERQVAENGFEEAWLAAVAGNARARRFYSRHGWSDRGPFIYQAKTASGDSAVPSHRYTKEVGRVSPAPDETMRRRLL